MAGAASRSRYGPVASRGLLLVREGVEHRDARTEVIVNDRLELDRV